MIAAACGGDDDATTVSTAVPETTIAETTTTVAETTTTAAEPVLGSIVDVATAAGTFTTLLAAVEAAGLTEDISTRQYTVLAPTDDVFEALGPDAIAAVLANPEVLNTIITDHLLPLPQTAEQLALFNNVIAVGGGSWPVTVDAEGLMIGNARVVTADIETDNGIIHVIDAVLIRPAEPTE